MLRSLKQANLGKKRVLVRCDFNAPLDKKGEVKDDWRLKIALPTIQLLQEQGAKVVLISHLDRPGSSRLDQRKNSQKKIARLLSHLLGSKVRFAKECLGKKAQKIVSKLKPGQVALLENLRFHPGEVNNERSFAEELAYLGDAYVNEAFSASHQKHASIAILPRLLPGFAGIRFEKEVRTLTKIRKNPKRPLVAIIGGTKVETKIKALRGLLKQCDHLLLGGRVSEVILTVKGIAIGQPWPPEEIVKIIRHINLTSTKLHLPVDVLVSPDLSGKTYVRQTGPGQLRKEEVGLDLGPDTVAAFKRIIKTAGTVIWAGPLGVYEKEQFSQGTKEIAQAIVTSTAFSVAGGGDTLAALKQFNLRNHFSFLSTGGGAMLTFLSQGSLPGLAALVRKPPSDNFL